MTRHQYVCTGDGAQFAVAFFAPGVVALDVDAPTRHFTDTPAGRAQMLHHVRVLAEDLSAEFGLGRFWLYETGHGAHLIFEETLEVWNAVEQVLGAASDRIGWHEDRGHVGLCRDARRCSLRVGFKPGREWDIEPWRGNSHVSLPDHVREHDVLITRKLPATQEVPIHTIAPSYSPT